MSVNCRKILLVLLLIASLIKFTRVFASSIASDEVAASLSDFVDHDKKEVSKIIKSNKRLLKSIKGLNSKDKTKAVNAVNKLDNSIQSGLSKDTIEKNLNGFLNRIQ